MKNTKPMTQIECVMIQAVLHALPNQASTLDLATRLRVAELASSCGVRVDADGTVHKALNATYIKSVETVNMGGGSMADILVLHDGRAIALNDEALCVYQSRDEFLHREDGSSADPLHHFWINESRPAVQPVAPAAAVAKVDINRHTETVLVVSTGNIPSHTAVALGASAAEQEKASLWNILSYVHWDKYGWIIHCGEDGADAIRDEHAELAHLIDFCLANKFTTLKLDCDAAPLEGEFPLFAW